MDRGGKKKGGGSYRQRSDSSPPTNKRERDAHEDGVGEPVRCAPVVGFRCGCVCAMGFEKDPAALSSPMRLRLLGADDRGGLDVTEGGGHANGALFTRVSSVAI